MALVKPWRRGWSWLRRGRARTSLEGAVKRSRQSALGVWTFEADESGIRRKPWGGGE